PASKRTKSRSVKPKKRTILRIKSPTPPALKALATALSKASHNNVATLRQILSSHSQWHPPAAERLPTLPFPRPPSAHNNARTPQLFPPRSTLPPCPPTPLLRLAHPREHRRCRQVWQRRVRSGRYNVGVWESPRHRG